MTHKHCASLDWMGQSLWVWAWTHRQPGPVCLQAPEQQMREPRAADVFAQPVSTATGKLTGKTFLKLGEKSNAPALCFQVRKTFQH